MRGKQAKRLRRRCEFKHLELVAHKQIPPPQSLEEARFQLRRLYQATKKRWNSLSKPKSLLSLDLLSTTRTRVIERQLNSLPAKSGSPEL